MMLLNSILETISFIFVKYFKDYESKTIDILNSIFSLYNFIPSSGKKNKNLDNEEVLENENSLLLLNSLILDHIKLLFKFNKNQLLNENIQELFEPLTNQVTL